MNSYENAHKGVSKIFTSQILDIISTICFFVGLILAVIALAGAAAGSAGLLAGGGIGAAVLMIGALVLTILAFIIKIVGCAKAGKDNASFHNAFLFSIAGIILAVAYAIIYAISSVTGGSTGIFDDIVKIILDLCKMFVLIYIINGCADFAAEKGNEDVANKARNVLYAIVILLLISLVCNFFGTAFVGTFAAVVCIILALAYVVGNVVAYILLLILLNKTKKMLAE